MLFSSVVRQTSRVRATSQVRSLINTAVTCMSPILRQWAILSLIPRAPRKIEASRIANQLDGLGIKSTIRTVQRDLLELAEAFPLACDDKNKPYGWQWLKDSHVFDIPGMDPQTALTFLLADEFLRPLLPPSTLVRLSPYFLTAKGVLTKASHAKLELWPSKVCIVPHGQSLKPPVVDAEVLTVVYEALLENRRFEALYAGRGRSKGKHYSFNPLGLVFRDGVIYLVATLWDYPDIKQFVLHRMAAPKVLDDAITPVGNFSLERYVSEHAFEYVADESSPLIRLVVRLDSRTAVHLSEAPLSDDQIIEPIDTNSARLAATVPNTDQLRWWLLGFGDKVEVLEPNELRQLFIQTTMRLSELYISPLTKDN
jgi:predicted DNA-binding transcriptional regulator YafY